MPEESGEMVGVATGGCTTIWPDVATKLSPIAGGRAARVFMTYVASVPSALSPSTIPLSLLYSIEASLGCFVYIYTYVCLSVCVCVRACVRVYPHTHARTPPSS